MFVFKPTEKTFSDPSSATFIPGVPFGPEYSRGDIAFLHEEFMGSKMFFNSKVLRQAILDSKDYLEEVLELKISDARKAEKEEVVEETTEPVVAEEAPAEETPEESTEEVEAPEVEEPTEESTEEVAEPVAEETVEETAKESVEPVVFEEAEIPVKEEKKTTKKK